MRQIWKFALLFGLFSLLAVALPAAAQTDQGSIAVGDQVTGELTSDETSHSYTLDAEAGDVVTITLTAQPFDTYLSLLDDQGNVLDENDDSSGTNSEITSFTLPEADGYTILVESYTSHSSDSGESGEYTLSVSAQEFDLTYGGTVEGRLTSSDPTQDFFFNGQADDVISIAQHSSDFDSYVYLYDSNDNQLVSDDDSGEAGNDSLIAQYALPEDGIYRVQAASFGGSATGNFTLTLNKLDIASIDFNEPLEVDFTGDDDTLYFVFAGTAGDSVTISADSHGSFDTDLVLRDLYSSEVASDQDGGSGNDPEIFQQSLSRSGTYTIAVTAVHPGEGTVTLTVESTPPPSLDDGVQTLAFSDSQYARAVTFAASSGETVRLNFHYLGDATGSPSITVTQDGVTIASASSSYITDLSISFTPTSDGQAVVQVTDYNSYNNPSYEVSLAHSAE
ncbi:MAG: PPC domain-containing protein [Chloroflexota bacterium]